MQPEPLEPHTVEEEPKRVSQHRRQKEENKLRAASVHEVEEARPVAEERVSFGRKPAEPSRNQEDPFEEGSRPTVPSFFEERKAEPSELPAPVESVERHAERPPRAERAPRERLERNEPSAKGVTAPLYPEGDGGSSRSSTKRVAAAKPNPRLEPA